MTNKDTTIKIRVTTKEKEIIKEVAKSKEMTMTDIILMATEQIVKKYKEHENCKEEVNLRCKLTDEKLREVKFRMDQRRSNSKSKDKLIYKIKALF